MFANTIEGLLSSVSVIGVQNLCMIFDNYIIGVLQYGIWITHGCQNLKKILKSRERRVLSVDSCDK
jgi:hypothetical protein